MFQREFDDLITEALQADFSGWDFSWLDQRWIESPLPWDYRQRVLDRLVGVHALLDMGTGGGEFLASLAPLPPATWATESYPPNIAIARARLQPLGVQVVTIDKDEALPFPGDYFDLVINRHDSFAPAEVYRILRPGGLFITQQVGGRDNLRLNQLLQDQVSFEFEDWLLENKVPLLEAAGFDVVEQLEAFPETRVSDIGAVVYHLRAIPWQIEGFTVEGYRDKLQTLHQMIQRDGGLLLTSHRFYVEAMKRRSSAKP